MHSLFDDSEHPEVNMLAQNADSAIERARRVTLLVTGSQTR